VIMFTICLYPCEIFNSAMSLQNARNGYKARDTQKVWIDIQSLMFFASIFLSVLLSRDTSISISYIQLQIIGKIHG
jgi:hypothetical protein